MELAYVPKEIPANTPTAIIRMTEKSLSLVRHRLLASRFVRSVDT